MNRVRKWAPRVFGAALAVFVVDWGLLGLKLLEGEYDIRGEAWVGAACLAVLVAAGLLMKAGTGGRCPRCGKRGLAGGAFCPFCGARLPSGREGP